MKRIFSGLAALGLFSASFLAGGCQNEMYEESVALHDQNRRLQSALTQNRNELQSRPTQEQLQAQQAAYESQLAERDRLISELQGKLSAPDVTTGSSIPGIEGVDVSINQHGELTMSVQGDVLFPSGSTKVNGSAESTLTRIADILKKDYSGNTIRVEGHTDTDPIVKTKKLYDDNRDLSLQRAYAVTKFLEGKGVDAASIETVGHGQYKPRGTDKKANRRVEIVVAS